MATLNVAAFLAALKDTYPRVRVDALAVKPHALLDWMPKADEFEGASYEFMVWHDDPQGRSHLLSKAIDNAETSRQDRFVLSGSTDRVVNYGVVEIDGVAMMAARSDKGSFLRARSSQLEGIIRTVGKSLHEELYGSGSGSIGQITAIDGTGTVLTLSSETAVMKTGKGQTLVANNTDDATTLKTGGVKIVGRDVLAKTITVNTDVTALGSAWAVNDYIFNEGDAGAAMTGLGGWIPLAAPTSTPFFGVDRTKDVTRLAGHRLNKPNRSVAENVQELAMLISREHGGKIELDLFANPLVGLVLEQQLGAKVVRDPSGTFATGAADFKIMSFASGPINVRFDWACPEDRFYLLHKPSWKLVHLGALPHIIMDDGQSAARSATEDKIQIRVRAVGNVGCFAPSRNGVGAVSLS